MEPSSSLPPKPPRNWWQRNWKWFVPTGCLSLILLSVLFLFSIILLVFGAMKSSDAYRIAVARAKADSRVTAAIGTPIEESWFLSGNTEVNGSSGKSALTIPIHGPKGKATIHAVAEKSGGRWEYSKLDVTVENTGETIDLTQESQ